MANLKDDVALPKLSKFLKTCLTIQRKTYNMKVVRLSSAVLYCLRTQKHLSLKVSEQDAKADKSE